MPSSSRVFEAAPSAAISSLAARSRPSARPTCAHAALGDASERSPRWRPRPRPRRPAGRPRERAALDDESEIRLADLGAVERERAFAGGRAARVPHAHALVREYALLRQALPGSARSAADAARRGSVRTRAGPSRSPRPVPRRPRGRRISDNSHAPASPPLRARAAPPWPHR